MADARGFAIYADWQCLRAVDQELLDGVDEAWDQRDETFCSSPGDDDPSVLVLSFDLIADSYDDAATQGQRRVEQLAQEASLEGKLLSVVAIDDEGQVKVTL